MNPSPSAEKPDTNLLEIRKKAFGALAAIIPDRQTARLDVVQALRYE